MSIVPIVHKTISDGAITAVGHHDGAGDIAGQFGREKDRRTDNILRLAGTPERRVIEKDFHQLRIGAADLFIERRFDEARANGVDAHAVLAEFGANARVKPSTPCFDVV